LSRFGNRHRELELDRTTFRKSNAVIEKALRSGDHLTRNELAERLATARISPAGQRLAHILGRAELAGLICSGARRGKQSTYALLDAIVPINGKPVARDEALAKLAGLYFSSRGPATVVDFAWWSGLAPAEAREVEPTIGAMSASAVRRAAACTYFQPSTNTWSPTGTGGQCSSPDM
jgi:hypothetical protein